MKSRLVVGMSTVCLLMVSAVAQDSSVQLSPNGQAPGVSNGNSSAAVITTDQLGEQLGPQDALRVYAQQMQMVFQNTCEELDAITQAVYSGKVTREQAEYLSAERFQLGMMQFQLLRTLYLSTAYDTQRASQPQESTELYVVGATVVVPPPSGSAYVPRQIATSLNLSPAQIAAIQAQIADDRKQLEPLVEQLAEQERAVGSVATTVPLDEKQVQALAARQSAILQQIIVANAREASKLFSMLTSEQQARVNKLQQNFMASAK